MNQGQIQDFFKGGLEGNSYTICKNYNYIHCNYFTFIILINKVHVSTHCAWSYSLHATVLAATMPDPILHRDAIACSISTYSASDNTPMQTRVWHHKIRSFMPSALPHGHFNPIASVLLSKSFNTSIRQFITWVQIVHLLTMHHVSTSSNHWIYFLP